jgi:ketosteroid isomerase-like protein
MTEATESNREVIRAAFESWQAGTAPITDVFAADMVWRIEGRSVASREYADRQEFVDEVLAPFAARFAAGERCRPVRVRSIVADGTAFYDSISFNDLWARVDAA